MRFFAQFFGLSDRYERKARLLPGLVLAAAPALTIGTLVHEVRDWYVAVGAAAGIEFLVATLLGHFARARGRTRETTLWASWGGPPTVRWLRPWDSTCSDQQKSKWRGAIKKLTGLSIPASDGDRTAVDQSIVEATRQLRYVLRSRPEASLLQTHNEDYGFARNLYGVRGLWICTSLLCVAAVAVCFYFGIRSYAALVVSIVLFFVSVIVGRELPEYVRRCADRYGESLLASALLAQAADANGTKSNQTVSSV